MTKAKKPVPPPVTPKAPPPPYADTPALESTLASTLESMAEMAEEYGADETPNRLIQRARAILLSPTLAAAKSVSIRCQQAMQVHVLSEWARGRIPGRLSEVAVERRVKQALSLASMLDSRGLHEQAEAQRQRAQRIRDEWEQHKAEVHLANA